MSQPWQQQPQQPGPYGQPQQPQQPGPYAQQPGPYAPQPGPYGQPPQAPQAGFGAPVQPGFPAPPVQRGNPGPAVLLAIVAMLVGSAVYGFILKAAEVQVGYLAVGTGALIGLALGKVGGRNDALPFIGALLGLIGVYLGQLFGVSLALSGGALAGALSTLVSDIGLLTQGLFKNLGPIDYLFYVLAAVSAFSMSKKLGAARG